MIKFSDLLESNNIIDVNKLKKKDTTKTVSQGGGELD